MPVYDALYDYTSKENPVFNHILVRHEQAAAHAAEGYARVSGKVGVSLVTSGPGVTNTITGIADAMMDNTPIVVIAGQVGVSALGSDAFQEVDLVGITQPYLKMELPNTKSRRYSLGNFSRVLYSKEWPSRPCGPSISQKMRKSAKLTLSHSTSTLFAAIIHTLHQTRTASRRRQN